MEDKRRFPRFGLPLPMVYYPQDNVRQFSYTISINVSSGGVCMPAFSGIIKDGDIIKMEIKIDKTHCVMATGKVRWVEMIDHDALLDKEEIINFMDDEEVGVEFIETDPSDIKKLLSVERSLCEPTFFNL